MIKLKLKTLNNFKETVYLNKQPLTLQRIKIEKTKILRYNNFIKRKELYNKQKLKDNWSSSKSLKIYNIFLTLHWSIKSWYEILKWIYLIFLFLLAFYNILWVVYWKKIKLKLMRISKTFTSYNTIFFKFSALFQRFIFQIFVILRY